MTDEQRAHDIALVLLQLKYPKLQADAQASGKVAPFMTAYRSAYQLALKNLREHPIDEN